MALVFKDSQSFWGNAAHLHERLDNRIVHAWSFDSVHSPIKPSIHLTSQILRRVLTLRLKLGPQGALALLSLSE